MEPVRTTCPYCGVGCGVLAYADGRIEGDPEHPANFGRLCSKGSALGETTDLDGRLFAPTVYGRRTNWDVAVRTVANRFSDIIANYGPDSVAFYVSGQLLTEDYYVANKLMKGFIGSANIDTNSRLCMASSVAGHKRAFGTDTVPGTYDDLEQADMIVLVGSNLAWCHPVLFQRIVAAKEARPHMRIVVVDPRRTASCDIADQHLAIAPGGDVALFNTVLAHLAAHGGINYDYARHVSGLDAAIAAAQADDAGKTGLSPQELNLFCTAFLNTEKVVTVYSQGVNQATDGTDKVNAIINCHLATGRIGRPGMGPLSVTGQPNAMGGREVGGLANMLACHLDLEDIDHRQAVQMFWGAPEMPSSAGLKAVDLFDAVDSGKIKALWVMSTNPAVSMPEANRVRDAIRRCNFVVVSDIMARTDTGDLADVLLPAAGWGEKDGTVTNSERMISRQRAFLPPAGEAIPDWKIICDVATEMGFGKAFAYDSPADIFREYAALSQIAAGFGRDFDISAVAEITDADYTDWQPSRWPLSETRKGGRYFADGRFFTPDGRARAIAVTQADAPAPALPYRFNTGRARDHWHTMTRTGKSARLSGHLAEPYLEIHPDDAAAEGIAPASLIQVDGAAGGAVLRALVSDRTPRGTVFAPIHWTAQWSSAGRVDAAVQTGTDPFSGQPALKSASVALRPFMPAWYGFAVSVGALAPQTDYWALAKRDGGYSVELAGKRTPKDWSDFASQLFEAETSEVISVFSPDTASARLLFLKEGTLAHALFVSPEPVAVARNFVISQLGQPVDRAFLAGRPGADQPDAGATVCSCFNVGVNTILAAIEDHGLSDIEAVGTCTQAGTNCGSCRPEIRTLLQASQQKVAAE